MRCLCFVAVLFLVVTQPMLARAERIHLPLNADTCAIVWALTGNAAEGCELPGYGERTLRSGELEHGGYSVTFALNSHRMSTAARDHLQRLSGVLNGSLRDLCIKLVGHTDTTGPNNYNQKLSERRASAVRLFMAGPGSVESARIVAEGLGELQPLSGIPGADGRNRRVEILARHRGDKNCD